VTTILGIADEGRAALMTAALGRPDEALDAWHRWEATGPDAWTDPVAVRWLPLIGWNLRHAALGERSRAAFRGAQHAAWAATARLLAAAEPVVAALGSAGVPVILLKGAALAQTVYETPALRPIGDVDLLIPPHEAERGLAILADLGWKPLRHPAPRDLMVRHGLNFERVPYGAVDLHWYLLPECCWRKADRGLWRRARQLPAGQLAALVLGPADQLLHVCIHGLRWSPVHSAHWVADAARVIAHAGPDLEWGVVVEEARRRGLALQMHGALEIASQVGGAPVPEAVMRALAAQPATWRDRLERHVKGRPVRSVGGVFLMWCGWRRLARESGSGRPDALRYLAAVVGAPSRAGLVGWAWRHAKAWARRRA
jgi:hypothetical protein